jgi:hypothetical protein
LDVRALNCYPILSVARLYNSGPCQQVAHRGVNERGFQQTGTCGPRLVSKGMGMGAAIVHHRLRPARCRIFATGTATMMINRRGIPRGTTQCHSGGTALQNQNWSQKNSISFLPAFFVTSGGLVDRAATDRAC